MITFYSIAHFRIRLANLLAIKRGVYAGVEQEICNEFCDTSMDKILTNRDLILLDDPLIVIKLRLPDRKHKLSKKDGFRLIYMTYKKSEKVVFLDVYPKNGPSQQLDISDSDLLDLLGQYSDEAESGNLFLHNINSGSL